jgi:hypothetical protein
VRTSDYRDVEGEIVDADEATGDCTLKIRDTTTAHHFGPLGMRIVRRRR